MPWLPSERWGFPPQNWEYRTGPPRHTEYGCDRGSLGLRTLPSRGPRIARPVGEAIHRLALRPPGGAAPAGPVPQAALPRRSTDAAPWLGLSGRRKGWKRARAHVGVASARTPQCLRPTAIR